MSGVIAGLLLATQVVCLAGAAVSLLTARRYLRRVEQLRRHSTPDNSTASLGGANQTERGHGTTSTRKKADQP